MSTPPLTIESAWTPADFKWVLCRCKCPHYRFEVLLETHHSSAFVYKSIVLPWKSKYKQCKHAQFINPVPSSLTPSIGCCPDLAVGNAAEESGQQCSGLWEIYQAPVQAGLNRSGPFTQARWAWGPSAFRCWIPSLSFIFWEGLWKVGIWIMVSLLSSALGFPFANTRHNFHVHYC